MSWGSKMSVLSIFFVKYISSRRIISITEYIYWLANSPHPEIEVTPLEAETIKGKKREQGSLSIQFILIFEDSWYIPLRFTLCVEYLLTLTKQALSHISLCSSHKESHVVPDWQTAQ